MKVVLVRHGEAVPSDTDPKQPLSHRGQSESVAVAKLMKSSRLEMDEIVHSPKLRAKQTAEIFRNYVAPDLASIQRNDLNPLDPVDRIAHEINAIDRSLLIVSHLPFLEKLLTSLLFGGERPSPVTFCCSCAVCLTGERHMWQIEWIATPSLAHDLI